jgi:hypothetical protein
VLWAWGVNRFGHIPHEDAVLDGVLQGFIQNPMVMMDSLR